MKIVKSIALSESGFMFDSRTGDSYTLNPVGFDIVTLLKEGKDSIEIQKNLIEKYDVDELSLERNMYEFLETLKHLNVIEDIF